MGRTEEFTIALMDIDGTLAVVRHRLGYIRGPGRKNWKRFFQAMDADQPIPEVIERVRRLARSHRVVLLTGRPEQYRERTEQWLRRHQVPYEELVMRPAGDHRPDYTVKAEALDRIGQERVALVLDDRPQVCDMFRARGLRVEQVASDAANQQVNETYRKALAEEESVERKKRNDGKIDLNGATIGELCQLPGIAKNLAYNIVNHRQAHGFFTDWHELGDVKDFPMERLDEIRQRAELRPPEGVDSLRHPRVHEKEQLGKVGPQMRGYTRKIRTTRRTGKMQEGARRGGSGRKAA